MFKGKIGEVKVPGCLVPEDIAVRGLEERDELELISFDSEAFGVSRAELIRQLLGDYPGYGFVAEAKTGGGGLRGYGLFRPGHHSFQIGPLIASGGSEAAALLKAVLDRIALENPAAQVGVVSAAGIESREDIYEHCGFTRICSLTRMYKGKNILQGREDMVYTSSGPEKG
ncbi:hypothetical protein ES703_94763 [subsurface metagenome]